MTVAELGGRRPYRSHLREEQARRTRRRVLEAATAAFLRRGYAGATMRTIAAAAGVSLPTVELLFGTKAAVLKAAIDVAVAGDDEPVPVLDRRWTRSALAAETVEEFLAVVASVVTETQSRSAGLVLAAFEAARTDPDIAALAERLVAQRQVTVEWLIDALVRTAPLRPESGRQDAVETLWILMDPGVYDALVSRRHWPPERYQSWFAQSARRLLVADVPGRPGEPARRST